jgi:hypothetical protein
MKKIILTLIIVTLIFVSCNQTNKKIRLNPEDDYVTPFHGNPLIMIYLNIENALIIDDAKAAAAAGKALVDSLKSFDQKKLTAKENYIFIKIKDDLIENAEHIGENADKIDHQREHFKMLSEDIYDFVKATGSPKTLYRIECPMYKNGSYWLSTSKNVKNPYMGQNMSSCGSVKDSIN